MINRRYCAKYINKTKGNIGRYRRKISNVNINVSVRPGIILRDTNVTFTGTGINNYCFWLFIRLIFDVIDRMSY